MVIVYHGNVKEIREQMAEYKSVLDQRYIDVLGPENAQKVATTAERILGPKSFLNNKQELAEILKLDHPVDVAPSNKMLITTPGYKMVNKEGKLETRKVNTSPLFHITEEAFKMSGSSQFTDKQIASYIHEYDHFIWYVLQKSPFYLANACAQDKLRPRRLPIDPVDYSEQLATQDLPISEKRERMLIALQCSNLENSYESANRILDKLILDSIGINAPIEWRNKKKEFSAFPLPSEGRPSIAMVKSGGDPFESKTDLEAISIFINWQDNYKTNGGTTYFNNIIESMREMKVSRTYIEDFLRTTLRRAKKEKNKRK